MSTNRKRHPRQLRLLTFQPKPAPATVQQLSAFARKAQALYERAPDSARILETLIDNINGEIDLNEARH